MFENDVVFSKISIIKNCLNTIKTVTELIAEKLDDYIVQDVFVLNLQRAIQACIDIANIIVSKKGLRLPASYKESFYILYQNKIIEKQLYNKLAKMVGFRNIAVHNYQDIDVGILKSVLKNNLSDFEEFCTVIFEFVQNDDDFDNV